MKKRVILIVVVAVLVLFAWQCRRGANSRDSKGDKDAAVPVTVAEVVVRAVPVELRTFGTAQPVATVAIRSQVTGILADVPVKEGKDVRAGDLLFKIDPRPAEAQLKQAEANLAKSSAEHENARKEAARQVELFQKGLAAEDAFDQARTSADALAAAVTAGQADVEKAKLELEYGSIQSPIDGRAGEIAVKPGNLVKANDAVLLTINQLSPIDVAFSVPQQQLDAIHRAVAAGPLEVRAFAEEQGGTVETGQLTFVDNQVDAATGTIRLKGAFANSSQSLWPGRFLKVVLTLSTQSDALVIPTPAIQTGQKGPYVFVVKPDLTVEDRMVTVARAMNGETVVSAGLKAGERVVTDGQLRLTPGARIEIKPAKGSAPAQGS
jgi:multidrug efflux system membrane fusion protein